MSMKVTPKSEMEATFELIDMARSVISTFGLEILDEHLLLHVMNLLDQDWEKFLPKPVVSCIKDSVSSRPVEYGEDLCVANVVSPPYGLWRIRQP